MPESLSRQQLLDISNEFGTPVYVYHAEKIKEQYGKLVSAFSSLDTKFFYACKALTNINILKYIDSLGCGIDCSSVNEVKLAVHAGVPKEKILFTGDACVNGPYNFAGDGDTGAWVKTLEAAKRLGAQTICPGHGPIGSGQILILGDAQRQLLQLAMKKANSEFPWTRSTKSWRLPRNIKSK